MYKVVIIDDNKITVQSLCESIPWDSLHCSICGTAHNGLDGIRLIQDCKPDIILTDIMMPGLTGLEMVQKLADEVKDASIIIITGYNTFEYARTALRLRVAEFILKPIDNQELILAVEKIIQEKGVSKTERPYAYIEREIKNYSALVREVLLYVNVNFAKGETADEIASKFKISAAHLSKRIKKEVGITLSFYITICRMWRAADLLKNPEYKVYEVAQQVGYSDYAYFFQVFKKFYNHSPTDER